MVWHKVLVACNWAIVQQDYHKDRGASNYSKASKQLEPYPNLSTNCHTTPTTRHTLAYKRHPPVF